MMGPARLGVMYVPYLLFVVSITRSSHCAEQAWATISVRTRCKAAPLTKLGSGGCLRPWTIFKTCPSNCLRLVSWRSESRERLCAFTLLLHLAPAASHTTPATSAGRSPSSPRGAFTCTFNLCALGTTFANTKYGPLRWTLLSHVSALLSTPLMLARVQVPMASGSPRRKHACGFGG